MSKWWENNVGDAGQGLFQDPATAFQVATIPDQILAGQSYADQMAQYDKDVREARGGFMQQMMTGLQTVGGAVDGAMSNIPGWGVTKNVANAAILQPVDKLASGLYWLYSNVVSQPLSTALLVGGQANIYGPGRFFSSDAWSSAYHEAEHISPGQALANTSLTTFTTDELPGVDPGSANGQLTDQQKRQTERFLYDTDYWHNREGWKYTLGTGTLDFAVNMADPIGGSIAGAARAAKSARALSTGAEKTSKSVVGAFAQGYFAKTPEEISKSKKINSFFDWAEGKSPFEIAQHPIWGAGRRKNPAVEQLSSLFSKANRDDMPLLLRFAAGDNKALQELATTSQNLVTHIGAAADNRVLLATHTWDADILDSYVQAQKAGNALPVGVIPSAEQALYEGAAKAVNAKRMASNYTPATWVARAKKWQAAKLQAADVQYKALQDAEGYLGTALGDNLGKAIDKLSPTDATLFGTLKTQYRMGPTAIKNTEKAADKNIKAATVDRISPAWRNTSGGVASRLIQRGYFSTPLRVYQSFGDRLPEGVVNHNDVDAMDRVNDMLKRVPGLGQENRLNMLNDYSRAGDKMAKAAVLKNIHTQIIGHMANSHNLDQETAQFADDLIKEGWEKSMYELSGRTPASQRFSAAKTKTGQYVDVIEDGTGRHIAPYAKTQLAAADPLLDVDALERIFSRNSGHLRSLKSGGGAIRDNITTFADTFNTMWKASTLLRGGYALRAPSEEIVAGAVKFGAITAMLDAGKGGINWALNRKQFVKAIVGRDGVTIADPDALAAAQEHGLKIENVQVNKAYPMVQKRISTERELLKKAESELAAIEKKLAKAKTQPTIDRLTEDINSAKDQIAEHNQVIQEHVDYSHEIISQSQLSTRRRIGEGTFTHNGVTVPQAFNKEWAGVIPRDQITSDNAMAAIYARGEAIDTARIMKTGSFQTIMPGEVNHMESWLDAINHQFAQDPLIKLVMQDDSLKTAKQFLASPAGRAHLRSLTIHARNPKGLLDSIVATLDQYLPKGTGLRGKVVNGDVIAEQDLRKAIAQSDFPPVHGEEIKALTTGKSVSRIIDDTIAKGFKILGTLPTDIMSRQPIYVRAHAARMRELIDDEQSYLREIGKSEEITTDVMNKMMARADTLARKDLSQVVYDPQRTTATQALRFVAPFLSAHIDGLERWAGLVAEKPELLNTASKIYNAPVAANLVTNQNGELVGEDGYVNHTDKDGKIVGRTFVPMTERVLNLKVPGQTRNVKGIGNVQTGGVPIKISSLNTILPGDPWWNPGTGPLVQIAGSEWAKSNPAMGDFLQWAKVLPYGPQGIIESITPKWSKELWSAWQADDPNNDRFQKAMLQEWQRQSAEHANGGPAPDMNKVRENAKSFYYLQALKAFAYPAQTNETPLTGTPYQFFVDQYKKLQDVNPRTAGDVFLATYGSDYYAFTASMNKSIGIASTAPAVETARMYNDIISQHPDLAGFIVGPYNQGTYSASANAALQEMTINGQKAKEKMTAYDAISENQRSLGWQTFTKMSGALDAALFRAGYHSYQESGAEGFVKLKNMMVGVLGQQYPSWEKDYSTTDKNAIPRRISAMSALARDERLLSDPMRTDVKMLNVYLVKRSQFKKELMARDNKSLTAESNLDLAKRWAMTQYTLAQADTKFNDVFNRYLGNDSLQ